MKVEYRVRVEREAVSLELYCNIKYGHYRLHRHHGP
jgi:hypothetical protein